MTGQEAYPVAVLAEAERAASCAPTGELSGMIENLRAAEHHGQLVRFLTPEGDCIGFIAWLRMTPKRLLEVSRSGQRGFTADDHTAGAPVAFIVEQLNLLPDPHELLRRFHFIAQLPGVEILAGWRGQRLRVQKVRTRNGIRGLGRE